MKINSDKALSREIEEIGILLAHADMAVIVRYMGLEVLRALATVRDGQVKALV